MIAALVAEVARETGDTRADLVAQLRHFRRGVERPFGMAMLGTVVLGGVCD